MKEDFLHYVWRFRKFDHLDLQTSSNESVSVIHPGEYLQLAGPDFFNAQLVIGTQKWAGNIEIHIKSSDWYLHQHEKDPAYENVILHVVWEHDAEIFRSDNTTIPVLEIKRYISKETLSNYKSLMSPKSWIYCERQLTSIDFFTLGNWLERLFFERLENKSHTIISLLQQKENDWEAVLFCLMAKNFGLNTNGEAFLKIALRIPFSIIRKENFESLNMEALLFGQSGLLDVEKEDQYFKQLRKQFDYLSYKYQLEKAAVEPLQFFKHRPDNFPTIRLSQLASLYSGKQNLFSEIINGDAAGKLYEILKVPASSYWQTHYQFDRESPKKAKSVSVAFADLIIINTILPIRFAFAKSLGKEISEDSMDLLKQIPAEKNAVIEKFSKFGIKANNAFESQALLQLKSAYCNHGKCLDCAIGNLLLKS
ncbi:hypothetical protein FNO01nite_00180 [Flavobacterium noncentrifugens]|uniref:DUF2851 domain-containing protein n=1 Tax=Flavobacterium noncentrifugens TaxID=1128970 RepID=A0A1G8R9I6_9FLAO|nr:DUF2851 family protein [Flavobacterium noncentrifugens]GEP49346.1 hypothetical protein FNO01nite_00180 [Flavobacterium noncentrifugens]SDJ13626.1 Protein of unknown function [Flavobacterium noncentrifugens]